MTPAVVILALLIVAGLALRHLQRAFFYPRPGLMPEAVDDIHVLLRRFENVLAEHAPDVLAALHPGLSDDDIRAIEVQYRVRLSDDMRALYGWRDGSPPDSRIESIPGHRFVPLEEALQQREQLRRELSTQPVVQRIATWVFAGHRLKWLTVLDDLCGDGYFYDPARRRRGGSFFYHFAEDRQYRFFPSVANFLAGAIECYGSGIYRRSRTGRSAEEHERSFELWSRYAAWRGT